MGSYIKKNIMRTYITILLMGLILFLSGCQEDEPDKENPNRIIGKGYSISPKSFEEEDFKHFLELVKDNSEVLRWAGVIEEVIGENASSAANTIQIAKDHGLTAVIDTQFYETPEEILSATEEEKMAMIEGVSKFCLDYKPLYLGLGTEINHKFDGHTEAIEAYAIMFEQAVTRIKDVSPETQVFVSFQYEWMNGYHGGIFGGTKDINSTQFDLLDLYNSADFIGFTTYPGLIFYEPDAIPYDYYDKISQHTDLPVAFTEIGWYSHVDFGQPWESSEDEQADFVDVFFERTNTIKPVLNIWAFMFEFFDIEPFTTMSFFDATGREKLAFKVWESYQAYPEDETTYRDVPIYFMSRHDHPQGELYLLDLNNNIRRITYNETHENNLALSNDGLKLAYHGGQESDPLSWEIFILDLETMETLQLTDNRLLDGHPDWSPDDSKIVYASFDDGNGQASAMADIYTIDLYSNEVTRLTDSEEEDNDPEWSPDGTMIVYKSTENTGQAAREEIYVMDADGSNKKRLTTVEGWMSDHDPSWSADSQLIAFERFEGSRQWFDIANHELLVENVGELTPWNTYVVALTGNLLQLTNEEVGGISFLPVFYPSMEDPNLFLYIQTRFDIEEGVIVASHKDLMYKNMSTSRTGVFVPYNEYFDTMEYFDW